MRKEIIITCIILMISAPSFAGDPKRGEVLFRQPSFGNGTNGKTCRTCHENGLDLAVNLPEKRNFEIMGVRVKDPADAVNFCIEVALRGEGIDPQGKEMADILAWLAILASRGGGEKNDP